MASWVHARLVIGRLVVRGDLKVKFVCWAIGEFELGQDLFVLGKILRLHFSIRDIFFFFKTTKTAATANVFGDKICGDFPVEFAGTSL